MVLKNLFTGQQWRNRHREQTSGHEERGGEGEMCGKSNRETYITICKIDSQWEFAWGWCTGMTQRDGMGREAGGGFRMGNTCTPMADAC